MLYDKRWDAKTKPDISMRSFVRWLKTKPANETYQIADARTCLIGQFLEAMGVEENRIAPISTVLGPTELGMVAFCGEPTFGAALRRARRLKRETL